jgi:predicted nuclease with TOPRIM domain
MSFTVADFVDLLTLLEQHPEWKKALRSSLLGEELLQLPDLVRGLAEGHARIQQEIGALAEAQRRTEERVGRLEQVLAELAEAQRRTEERVGRLEQVLAELAEAQRRTEVQVAALAHQVGRLSDTVGFTLEELARELAPAYLEKHHGIRVPVLERRFFTVAGEEIELDLYGEGTRDGEPIAVVGEVRTRLYGRDVEVIARRVQALSASLPARAVPVLFGYVIHPSAEQVAGQKGVLVLAPIRGGR